MDNLIDVVELQVVAPKSDLTALDQALAKLRAFESAIDGINAKLSGLSTNSAFKRTQTGIQEVIQKLESASGKGAPLKDISKALGFDPKDVDQFRQRGIEDLKQQIERSEKRRAGLRGTAYADERKELVANEKKLQSELRSLRETFLGPDLKLSSAVGGAKFFSRYQKAALKETADPISVIQSLVGANAQSGTPSSTVAGPAGLAKVSIPASQIEALLGPGAITLTVSPGRIQATTATGTARPSAQSAPIGETSPGVGQAAAAVQPQSQSEAVAAPPVPLQPSASEPAAIPPANVSVENVLPANAPHAPSRRVPAQPLSAEQQLWRNAARQLASSGVELGKIPGQWTEAERSWISKNVKLEGIPPEQIQALTSRIVRAARVLRQAPTAPPASRLHAPEPALAPLAPKVEVPPAIVQPNPAPDVSVAAPTVNVAAAEAPVIPPVQLPAAKPTAPLKPQVLRYAGSSSGQARGGWKVEAIMSHGPAQTVHSDIQTKKERNETVERLNQELKAKGQYVSLSEELAWKNTPAQAKERRAQITGEVLGTGKDAQMATQKQQAELALKYHAAPTGDKATQIFEQYRQASGNQKVVMPTAVQARTMLREHQEWQVKKQELLKEYDVLRPVAQGKPMPEALRAPPAQPELPIGTQGSYALDSAKGLASGSILQAHPKAPTPPPARPTVPSETKPGVHETISSVPATKSPSGATKMAIAGPMSISASSNEEAKMHIPAISSGESIPPPAQKFIGPTEPALQQGAVAKSPEPVQGAATIVPPGGPPKPPVASGAPASPIPPGGGSGQPVPLVVPSSRIAATLGPGDITLIVPPGRIQASGGAQPAAPVAPASGAAPPVPPGGSGPVPATITPIGALPPGVPPAVPGPPGPPSGPAAPGGNWPPGSPLGKTIEEKITTKAGRIVSTQRRELIRSGQTIDRFAKAVHGVMEPTKEVTTISPLKAASGKLQEQVTGVKADLQEQLTALQQGAVAKSPGAVQGAATQGIPSEPSKYQQQQKIAALYRKQADIMRSFVGKEEVNPQTGEKEFTPSPAAKQLQSLGQGKLVSQTRVQAAKLEQQAAAVEERAEAQRQTELGQEMRRTGQVRKVLHDAKVKGDKEEADRIASELAEERAAFEKRVSSRNKFVAAGSQSEDKKQAMARKVAERETLQEQARTHKAATEQEADVRLGDFLQSGGRIKRTERQNELRPGSPRRVVAERETGGNTETMVVTYGKAEATVQKLTKAQGEARKEGGYLAGDFVKNTAKVTLWAASVGILYKSLELVNHSIERLIAIGPQVGRLEQIFKGVGGTAHQVALDTLEMAAQMGASGEQAMEAAIQWARLGLSRIEINEAVRQSMIAANVAQIDGLEATEKLQGVMKAYGLGVGELRGELGQIVAVTNSYNVTTEDMLTGLSRVAAVAKQAGLPLAELHGLLGATIGGTAQSGANIGNMLKSVILALSNPDLQNKLRMNFKFEATTGGEEIKGMSTLIADLFVKFQHLNQLQQQSMLFSVAGRTQASRLQALLEGYVKAQVLAVNAQLHLNTAEQENTKITATLKAQLHGVAAEWERFVFVQGNRGPVQAMTEMATATRNVLRLMNTPIGGAATTGILGLLAAGGIKSIVTGMSLKTGEGFLSRSGAHVRSALGEFNNSMMAVYAGSMQGGLASNIGTRRQQVVGAQQPGRNPLNPIGPELFTIDKKMYVWSEAMLRVGRSSAIGSSAVRSMATALGTVTRALGVGFIALRSFLLPIAVIGGAMYAFNRAVEAVGASSENAERKLAGFNDEVQAAAAAANAYAESAQAINTIEKAIQPERGFKPIQSDRQKQLVDQSTELFGLYEPDLTKQQAIQRSLKAQLDLMLQQGNVAGVLNLMDEERNKLLDARAKKLQEEFVHIQAQRKAADDEIKRLKAVDADPIRGMFFKEKRAQNITQKEKEVQDLSMSSTRNLTDQSAAYEERLQYDEKYQGALRTQKLLWESIGEIYQSVNANNPIEKSQNKIASLQAQDQAIEHHLKMLDQEDKTDIESRSAIDQRKSELKTEETATRSELETLEKRREIKLHPTRIHGFAANNQVSETTEELDREIRKRQESLQVNERLINDAGAGHGAGVEAERFAARGALRTADTEKRREIRGDIEAETRNLPLAEVQTRMEFGREQAKRETTPFAVGRDETQKLQNLQEGIRKVLSGLQEMPQSAELLSREIDLQNQRYENQIALRNRSMTLERDILQLQIDQRKEMEHSILGAGPAELLRKLAAMRMGSGGRTTMGQFLSLSPEMRRDVAMVDTRFDPRMIDLQRERRRYTRQPEEEFERGLRNTSDEKQKMVDRVQANVPELSTFNAAAKVVSDFAGEISIASTAVKNFSDKLDAALNRIGSGGGGNAVSTVGNAPRNPQSGGVGAGAGFIGGGGGGFIGHGAGGDF